MYSACSNNNEKNSMHTVKSRLKSRKVLGVGECADGTVPRSKISQILGYHHYEDPWMLELHNYPFGLRFFQYFTLAYYVFMGSINMFFPEYAFQYYTSFTRNDQFRQPYKSLHTLTNAMMKNGDDEYVASLQAVLKEIKQNEFDMDFLLQVNGMALFSLACLFANILYKNYYSSRSVRTGLCVQAAYTACTVIVTSRYYWIFTGGEIDASSFGVISVVLRLFVLLLSFYYTLATFRGRSENGQKYRAD